MRCSAGDVSKSGVFAANVPFQVSAYGREEKGTPMSSAPVSCGVCDVMARTVQRCVRLRAVDVRCAKAWAELAFVPGCDVCGKKGPDRSQETLPRNKCCFAKDIEQNGLKVSKDATFGPGVYTVSDIEKAAIFTAQHETKRGFGVVLDVDLGRCKTHCALGCSKSHQPSVQTVAAGEPGGAGAGIKRTETVVRNPRQIAILGVIMESVRHSPSDCREKGNARKDCSKLSAWQVGCERCKTEGTSDTGKLECAPSRPGGQGSATTGGEEARHQVTAIDSGVSPRMHRGIQKRGNACQSLSTWRFNFLDRLSPLALVSAMLGDFGFIAQCRGSIIGTMVADEMNDWPSSSCCVRQLGSPRGRLHNEDGSSKRLCYVWYG